MPKRSAAAVEESVAIRVDASTEAALQRAKELNEQLDSLDERLEVVMVDQHMMKQLERRMTAYLDGSRLRQVGPLVN